MVKTIFLDIDGTLLKHHNGGLSAILTEEPTLLPGVIDKLNEWEAKGYYVILTTGRAESMREFTEKQLESLGVYYNSMIMGLKGDRILINDKKWNGDIAGYVFNVDRNVGIKTIDI
jgi:hydroxymethylpyrimidine pyrophosphatase-like HAD family hydrolase